MRAWGFLESFFSFFIALKFLRFLCPVPTERVRPPWARRRRGARVRALRGVITTNLNYKMDRKNVCTQPALEPVKSIKTARA